MQPLKPTILAVAALAAAGLTSSSVRAADTNSVTLRTTGYFLGLTQGTNPVSEKLYYKNVSFAGHQLVNLAMGRNADETNHPAQVLAMTFQCDLSAANLVVYDLVTTNIIATIASSTSVDSIKQDDPAIAAVGGPTHARFVATVAVNANGNGTNGLVNGYFTIAGRVNLNPRTGCPQPVLVVIDRDPYDKAAGDIELPPSLDPDTVALVLRTGLAHLIGVLDATVAGETETILVPYGGLSIRRELPDQPAVVTPGVSTTTSY